MAMIHDRIEMNAKVMVGKPVIRGTRIPVELILRKLGEGATEEDILKGPQAPTDVQTAGGRKRGHGCRPRTQACGTCRVFKR